MPHRVNVSTAIGREYWNKKEYSGETMLLIFIVFQITLPLILIAWISFKPTQSLLGFWVQIFTTASLLLLSAFGGIWLFPPWWMPFVYGVLLIVATYLGLMRRRPFQHLSPNNISGWIKVAIFILISSFSINEIIQIIRGLNPPEVELVNLQFPLEDGSYFVANGGSDIRINAHMKTMDASIPRFRKWRGNAYGIDIVGVNKLGFRANGVYPSNPNDYYIFGAKVLAPCSGQVIASSNDMPDMQIPEVDKTNFTGNYVLLRSSQANILIAHFRKGSLKVGTGDRVEVGQEIAEVGNSGYSDEPHLHIHAQRPGSYDAPFSGDPLAIIFDSKFLVRNDLWIQKQ